jgi:hypothetical protein
MKKHKSVSLNAFLLLQSATRSRVKGQIIVLQEAETGESFIECRSLKFIYTPIDSGLPEEY